MYVGEEDIGRGARKNGGIRGAAKELDRYPDLAEKECVEGADAQFESGSRVEY